MTQRKWVTLRTIQNQSNQEVSLPGGEKTPECLGSWRVGETMIHWPLETTQVAGEWNRPYWSLYRRTKSYSTIIIAHSRLTFQETLCSTQSGGFKKYWGRFDST